MSSQCISRALLEWWDTLQDFGVTCVICTVMHSKKITKGSGNEIFLFVSNLMCLFLIMQQFIPSTCHSIPQLQLKAVTQFPFRTSRTITSWSPKNQAGTAKPAHYPSVHSLISEPLDVEEPAMLPLKVRGQSGISGKRGLFQATTDRNQQRMGIPHLGTTCCPKIWEKQPGKQGVNVQNGRTDIISCAILWHVSEWILNIQSK